TSTKKYDLIVIGSRRRHASGRTYEIIKAIEPPVLVAIGACERLSRILLCSGGKHFIDDAVRLTGTVAAALHAEVTLFHVVAEPPAIYAHLVQLEENVDALLASGSELGRNLLAEKKALEKLGVVVNVRVRHGFVVDQLLDEMRDSYRSSSENSPRINPSPIRNASIGQAAMRFRSTLVRMPLSLTIIIP